MIVVSWCDKCLVMIMFYDEFSEDDLLVIINSWWCMYVCINGD